MNRNFDAIIFDFDGTLYDNYKIGKHLVLSNIFYLFKIGADRKIRKAIKGVDFGSKEAFFNEYYKRLSERTGMSCKRAQKWYETKYIPFMIKTLKKHYKCQPEIPELFKLLEEKGIKTAILSDYDQVPARMEAVGIDSAVCKNLYSSVELGGLKPAGRPFIKVAEDLGVAAERVLVVGDRNDTDGQGARNCGMQFIQMKIQGTKEKAEDVKHPLLSWNEFIDYIKTID